MTPSTTRWRRTERPHNIDGDFHFPGRLLSGPALCVQPMKKKRNKIDESGTMRLRIERAIRAIPRGKVSTYGGIAKMAGYPGAARMVARILRRGFGLPWQRVLGAGGEIKLTGDAAIEQRLRLEAEGVRFRGRKVDMKAHEFRRLTKETRRRPSNVG